MLHTTKPLDQSPTKAAPPPNKFSAVHVNRVLRTIGGGTPQERQALWLRAVAKRTSALRPDLETGIQDILGVHPADEDLLQGLTIGEIGVCYEALLAEADANGRRSSGQFFTPDDAANFMAEQSLQFPAGIWIDPCCGVGNLAWHLAATRNNPGTFTRDSLMLIDMDEVALQSAVALISAQFLAPGDIEGLYKLRENSKCRNFLSPEPLPKFDFAILNPPYARTAENINFESSKSRDLSAYFLEKVSSISRGYISVTPASYLSAPKFETLRRVVNANSAGGKIFIYDNVPDTLFRGYKYGSANTSKTNFVRAAITVSKPEDRGWLTTPILRWQSTHRREMFKQSPLLLTPRRIGPHGEWTKLYPELVKTWDYLAGQRTSVADLTVDWETEFHLDVGLTPRYFISAAYRNLSRSSKSILYFKNESDRDHAATVLNSSVPYIWWRVLDGGVTLPKRILNSTPLPPIQGVKELARELRASESNSIVTKLNAGKLNENVKHPVGIVNLLNSRLLPTGAGLEMLYSNNMFPLS